MIDDGCGQVPLLPGGIAGRIVVYKKDQDTAESDEVQVFSERLQVVAALHGEWVGDEMG